MLKKISTFIAISFIALLTACQPAQTADEKIKAQMLDSQHALTADERILAEINAKQFFEKNFPQQKQDGSMIEVRGYFTECRPSDSNFNGLVTCQGKVPNINGGFQDVKRYCGYRKELVGCNDVDAVK